MKLPCCSGRLAKQAAASSDLLYTASTPEARFRMPGVHTSRLVRRTGPPPMRQLTSMRRGPRLVYFSSTWNTPCRGGSLI